jgi:MFS family permease
MQISNKIPKNILLLGLVSFLTDFGSEMIYPLIPFFLSNSLGGSPLSLGLIEGIAESTASLSKIISGRFSDRLNNRKIFAILGYSISLMGKALLPFSASWTTVLTSRFIDRIGKGVRTAPRDALIIESAKEAKKGASFGFHRAMDSAGALFGVFGALLVVTATNNIKSALYFALFPLFIAIILLFGVKEQNSLKPESVEKTAKNRFSWKHLRPELKYFMLVSLIFSLGNSSNMFLILKAYDLGSTVSRVILFYALLNIASTVLHYPFGILSDKIPRPRLIISGYLLFSFIYTLIATQNNPNMMWLIFPLYGCFEALTAGIEKAYISDLSPDNQKATALGLHSLITGVALLPSSLISGFFWNTAGPAAPFLFSALTGYIACIAFLIHQQKITANANNQI